MDYVIVRWDQLVLSHKRNHERHVETWKEMKNMLGSVVAVAFQITFCAEMHANDVFSFFKNHF
jgi:hypothetical protein